MKEDLIIILIFVAIVLLLGILIVVTNILLPKEKEKSKKILEILKIILKGIAVHADMLVVKNMRRLLLKIQK